MNTNIENLERRLAYFEDSFCFRCGGNIQWVIFEPDNEHRAVCLKCEEENRHFHEFVSQLSRIQFEEWHGHYDGEEFWIYDSEGEGIVSGKDAFDAWRKMEKL